MPKSEVLIEMPEFEKKYNLAMVDSEKVTSRVRPKQFLHIDEAECILCEGCVDICPWKCIHYLSYFINKLKKFIIQLINNVMLLKTKNYIFYNPNFLQINFKLNLVLKFFI